MTPALVDLYAVSEATWPPARVWQASGATLRDGQGGGKRVSAATCDGMPEDLPALEAAMRHMGQDPLFMVRAGENRLDDHLKAAGYRVIDPVEVLVAPISRLLDIPIPPVTAFNIWKPLAIMIEIWAQGGIGAGRLAVMDRVPCKTGILSRLNDKPAGVAFAGLHAGTVMVHAVEVLPHQRRKGAAQWMMRKAAVWGAEQGADWISVLCTRQNLAAQTLYAGMGFTAVGGYHYRIKENT